MSGRRVLIAVVAIVSGGAISGQEPESRQAAEAESRPATRVGELRVVRAPDGLPAAGAIVEFMGIDSTKALRIFGSDDATSRPSTTPTLVELIADEDGVVRLPRFGESCRVAGRSGDFTGKTWIRVDDPEPAVLMLAPPVAVLVVDSTGLPQPGVPVALVGHPSHGLIVYERGTTGPDGVARVPPLPQGRASLGRDKLGGPAVYAALAIPLGESVEVPLDPDRSQLSRLELVLPPTGRVTVRLVASDEKPFLGAATVELRLKDLPREKWSENLPVLTAQTDGGIASFPFVGVTPRLSISVHPEDPTLHTAAATIEGPRTADRETTATVVCGALATFVTGRLVGSDSRPLANMRFSAWIPQPPETSCTGNDPHGWFRRTDADGRFELRFDVDAATLTATELLLSVGRSGPGADTRAAGLLRGDDLAVPLPVQVRMGSVALGDIVVPGFAALPVVATGRVVSDHGVPVPHAEIRVMRRWRSEWDHAYALWEVGRPAGADSRFELRGRAEGKNLGLIATGEFWICADPAPFEIGARNVDVIVSRAGGLEGSVTGLGKPISTLLRESPINVLVAGPGAGIASRNQVRHGQSHGERCELEIEQDKFATHELLPGTYSVQFGAPWDPKPLLEVAGIVVKAGEVTRDPRLQGVDLTRFMQKRIVTVVDDRGTTVASATVGVRDASDSSRGFTKFSTYPNGRAVVLTAVGAIDLVVAAEGHLAVTVPNVTGDTVVTMQRALPRLVTIRLDDSVVLPPPPFSITADLRWLCPLHAELPERPDWSDPRSTAFDKASFGCARIAMARVQNPGVYEVQLMIDREEIWGGGGSGLDQKERRRATVAVGEIGDASVTVTVDADDLKKSIERGTSR